MKFSLLLIFLITLPLLAFAGGGVDITTEMTFIDALYTAVWATWPDKALTIGYAVAILAQFIPEKFTDEYGETRWYSIFTYLLHRLAMNNGKAKNAL